MSFKDQGWPFSALFFLEYDRQFLANTREGLRTQGAFKHANSASRLYAAWFATFNPDSVVRPLEWIGMRVDRPVRADRLGATARIALLEGGALVALQPKETEGPAREYAREGSGVMGVTVAVKSVDSVLRSLKVDGAPPKPYAGLFGRSVLIGPAKAHGAWVEFAEIP